MNARIALCLLLVAGCDAWRMMRNDDSPRRQKLEIALASHCARPVEVCYGSDVCLTLTDAKPRWFRAEAPNGQVRVTLPAASRATDADEIFTLIEVDDSCERLVRRLGPVKESTAATAGGPSR